MKNIILSLFLLIFFDMNLTAQEPTNSAAKIYYKGVQKHFAYLKSNDPQSNLKMYLSEVDKAEEKIKLIKKSQADYDVTTLQNELATYKNAGDKSENDKNNTNKDAFDLSVEMDKIFKAPTLNDYTGGQAIAEAAIKDYKTLTGNFISNNAKQRVDNAKKANRYRHGEGLTSEMLGFDKEVTEIKNEYNKSDTETGAIAYYYLANKYLLYWETAKNCMPEEKLFSDNYTLIANLFKEMGSVDAAKTIAKSNAKAKMAKVKIPVAVRKDAATETLFKQTFAAQGWNETILIINLRDTDWSIVKNEYTGVIVGRAQTAAIAAKNKNGDCILYIFTIMQDYNGSGYQTTAHRRTHDAAPMLCENVK